MWQTKVAAQEALKVLIDTWTPHEPSLDSLIFDGEVGSVMPVDGAMDNQWVRYGGWLYFVLEKEPK